MKIVEENDFDEEIKNGITIVDFFATWCGPCRLMSAVLEDCQGELEGRAKIIKVDTDNSEKLASKFGIMSIPTIIIFKDGQMLEKHVGLMQKDAFIDFVTPYLNI